MPHDWTLCLTLFCHCALEAAIQPLSIFLGREFVRPYRVVCSRVTKRARGQSPTGDSSSSSDTSSEISTTPLPPRATRAPRRAQGPPALAVEKAMNVEVKHAADHPRCVDGMRVRMRFDMAWVCDECKENYPKKIVAGARCTSCHFGVCKKCVARTE